MFVPIGFKRPKGLFNSINKVDFYNSEFKI